MTRILLLTGLVGWLGCEGTRLADPTNTVPQSLTTTVSGLAIDVDLLGGTLAQNPAISRADLLAAAAVKNVGVFVFNEDGSRGTQVVETDATGAFSIDLPADHTYRFATASNAYYIPVYDDEAVPVGRTPVTSHLVKITGPNPYSAVAGVAAARQVVPDDLTSLGVCVIVRDAAGTPQIDDPARVEPLVAGFTAYTMTDPRPQPTPTFQAGVSSPTGVFAIARDVAGPDTDVSFAFTDEKTGVVTSDRCGIKAGFASYKTLVQQ